MNKLVICVAIAAVLSGCGGGSEQASSTKQSAPVRATLVTAPAAAPAVAPAAAPEVVIADVAPVAQGIVTDAAQQATVSKAVTLRQSAPAASAKVVASALAAPCTVNCFNKRYIYFGGNFVKALKDDDTTFAKLKDVIRVGHENGYNGIMLNPAGSGSFATSLTGKSQYYDANFAALVEYAASYQMELIPVGLSPDSITTTDANLIEALPAKDRPFLVSNGVATSSGADAAPSADFESGTNGWSLFDNVTRDTTVGHSGTGSIKFDENGGQSMMRLYREITNLQPKTAYRMSFWIKTSDFDAPLKLQIYDGQTVNPIYLNASNLLGLGTAANGNFNAAGNTVAQTQDWTEYNVDFNTLGNSTIRIYLGTWSIGTHKGAAWVDDVRIKEVGLNHVVSRASYPVEVRSATGVKYEAGSDKDYVVGVEKLTIPASSRIKNGDTLKVTWGQSARGISSTWGAPASACYSSYFDNSKSIASKTFTTLGSNKSFFVYFDEWRVMNWDTACGNISAGKYLENTFRGVRQKIEEINPNAEVYVWNDMFDPYHNAKTSYWMVNGDLTGGIDGLGPNTIVVNWNEYADKQVNSLKYFADKGKKQLIALYYDDNANLTKTNQWLTSLNTAQGQNVSGIDGFVYTTWAGDNGYADLKKVADLLKATGRWPQ